MLQSRFSAKVSIAEWVLVAYVVSFTTEEIRQARTKISFISFLDLDLDLDLTWHRFSRQNFHRSLNWFNFHLKLRLTPGQEWDRNALIYHV